MRRLLGFLCLALVLAACNDDSPSASDIEEGYRNLADKNLARAVADFGSEDQVPPIILGIIKMTARIDNPRCEKNPNDLGYLCLYNYTPVNTGGVMLDEVPDIKARVWQADVGWMVHEIPDGEDS